MSERTQYEEFVNEIADDLTEALGRWVGIDEVYVPDSLRPFVSILSKVWEKQVELKKGQRCNI